MEQQLYSIQALSDWDVCAQAIAPQLQAGDILTLSGSLGAGKTTFTQALARILGAQVSPRSPTFSLMRTYPLQNEYNVKHLVHIDAYRLESASDVLALNLEEEQLEPGTIFVIEWPEHMQDWLTKHGPVWSLQIRQTEGEVREVRLEKPS